MSGRCGLCGNRFGQRAEELVHVDCIDEMNRRYDMVCNESRRRGENEIVRGRLLAAVLWEAGSRLPDSLRRAIEAEGIVAKPREEKP